MLKNVTITLEEEAARWVRIKAAEENTSVSKLVGRMIESQMRGVPSHSDAFERWKRLELERPHLSLTQGKRMTREEANERHPEWTNRLDRE